MQQDSNQLPVLSSMLFLRHIPEQQKPKNPIPVLVVSFKTFQFLSGISWPSSIPYPEVTAQERVKPSRLVVGKPRDDQDFRYIWMSVLRRSRGYWRAVGRKCSQSIPSKAEALERRRCWECISIGTAAPGKSRVGSPGGEDSLEPVQPPRPIFLQALPLTRLLYSLSSSSSNPTFARLFAGCGRNLDALRKY